ncbi:unnamed protein product [Rotaria sp. Silwood1]|nr:unnamed protein product [Rotaria sp. Silwood1]
MKIFIYGSFILSWLSIYVYSFGHSLLPLFYLDPSYININHDVQVAMEKLRQKLNKYVNCDPDDLVIVDNTSAAINSILKSLKLKSNETILYYNVAYGMVKLTLEYVLTEIFTQEQIIQIELDHQTIQNTDLLLKKKKNSKYNK